MTKRLSLLLGAMLIVFSLTLSIGGAVSVFYLAPGTDDKHIYAGLFYGGAMIMLFGLAGFLAGLVGMIGSVLLKVSEGESYVS